MTSYREAGVDLGGAERHVEQISGAVTSTWTPEVVGMFGGFAAGVRIPADVSDPVLMLTTDGVGTKIELARRLRSWRGIGQDLVAMCVDDLAAAGARPIGFVDYLAVGALEPTRDRAIVESIATACSLAGCPLLGGETAEHPGVMSPETVDLAGAAMGVAEGERLIGPSLAEAGDGIIGLHSPNLRSNGFSLVRTVLGGELDQHGSQLLAPSVIYSPAVQAALSTGHVRSAAHVTGGGLAHNLGRALPDGAGAVIDLASWERPSVFDLVASYGVDEAEMRSTFNLGIGFCLVVSPAGEHEVLQAVAAHRPALIGRVDDSGSVTLA